MFHWVLIPPTSLVYIRDVIAALMSDSVSACRSRRWAFVEWGGVRGGAGVLWTICTQYPLRSGRRGQQEVRLYNTEIADNCRVMVTLSGTPIIVQIPCRVARATRVYFCFVDWPLMANLKALVSLYLLPYQRFYGWYRRPFDGMRARGRLLNIIS